MLWYRKSFVEKAGIDMSKPVTWDQIIDAAAENGGKVAVQANKYEGYVVWINALISGAGGEIATDTEKGVDLTLEIDSPAGETAAEHHREAGAAPRPHRPTCRSPTRARRAARSAGTEGAFMVNWTYIWTNYDATQPEVKKDIGFARYPQSTSRARSPARRTAASASASARTPTTSTRRWRRSSASRRPENQGVNAELTGNMPASAAGYDYPALAEIYPQPTCSTCSRRASTRRLRAPSRRTGATSPAASRAPGTRRTASTTSTPPDSQQFIEDVLHGRSLL